MEPMEEWVKEDFDFHKVKLMRLFKLKIIFYQLESV
jgi:hypothetical protein